MLPSENGSRHPAQIRLIQHGAEGAFPNALTLTKGMDIEQYCFGGLTKQQWLMGVLLTGAVNDTMPEERDWLVNAAREMADKILALTEPKIGGDP